MLRSLPPARRILPSTSSSSSSAASSAASTGAVPTRWIVAVLLLLLLAVVNLLVVVSYRAQAHSSVLHSDALGSELSALAEHYNALALQRLCESWSAFSPSASASASAAAQATPLIPIVVYVRNRPHYLQPLLAALSQAAGIEHALLIVSHDLVAPEMLALVKAVRFTRVLQLIHPNYALTRHTLPPPPSPHSASPPPTSASASSTSPSSTGAAEAHPTSSSTAEAAAAFHDARGAMRLKRHWWWVVNHVFGTVLPALPVRTAGWALFLEVLSLLPMVCFFMCV
jgi:hypothetical protein